jgi:putative transposase
VNTQVNSKLKGYVNSHTKKRSKHAEKGACLTLRDMRRILARYFCDEYNQDICPKDRKKTRYQKWQSRLPGGKPRTIDEQELDICLMKQEKCKVYKNGTVFFLNQRYRGECLETYKGYVALLYDCDRILQMRAYTWTGDGKLGHFLGFVQMINTEELGIDEAQLASGDFSLDELKAILDDINAGENAAEASTRHIRAAARKARYDFADGKAKGKKERQQQEQTRIRREAKGLDQPTADSTQSDDNAQPEVEQPKSAKVVNLQQQRRKRNVEFFDELLRPMRMNSDRKWLRQSGRNDSGSS